MKTDAPAIAKTELVRVHATGESIPIVVEIGTPYRAPDGPWRTPVALHGLDGRLCDICGEDGDSDNELLCCDLCPKAFHVRCVGLTATPAEDTWACPVCAAERCGTCDRGPVPASESILCGDGKKRGCDAAHHLRCVGLAKPPAGDWLCDKCTAQELQQREAGRPTRSRAAAQR